MLFSLNKIRCSKWDTYVLVRTSLPRWNLGITPGFSKLASNLILIRNLVKSYTHSYWRFTPCNQWFSHPLCRRKILWCYRLAGVVYRRNQCTLWRIIICDRECWNILRNICTVGLCVGHLSHLRYCWNLCSLFEILWGSKGKNRGIHIWDPIK